MSTDRKIRWMFLLMVTFFILLAFGYVQVHKATVAAHNAVVVNRKLIVQVATDEANGCKVRAEGRIAVRELIIDISTPQPGEPPFTPAQQKTANSFQARLLPKLPLITCTGSSR